jgi:hypothetical protein
MKRVCRQFQRSLFHRTYFRARLYYKQRDIKKSVRKNYRFQKAALFRISTEGIYYSITEIILVLGKQLRLPT